MKKICVFIGSRANYSSCKSIMKAIKDNKDLKLQIVLGGPGILYRFGNIEKQIIEDGFTIDSQFYMIVEGENPLTMAKSTGLGIIEITTVLNNLNPDMLLVVGDRFDVFSPVIAASLMNIPIAHTMGGEVTGTIDESIRHAITKLAHLHFPANEDARKRIIKMGEIEKNVYNVGCPRIDIVKNILENKTKIDKNTLFNKYKGVGEEFDLEAEPFLLVSQHPVTTEYGKNRKVIEETLNALNELKMHTIMIWPNIDAGSDEISKGIRTFRENEKPDWLHLFINLPINIYLLLMEKCTCMVGNSSSAIREGAYIGVPAVNIGSRQNGRVRGKNVLDVKPHKGMILSSILKQIEHGKYSKEFIYGDGNAGKKIAKILVQREVEIQKKIAY